jgi:hypothetical protein
MFDQGLAQAFGFNHEAAIRSFERAAELDPAAAMPHWGKAWALGPNYNLDIDDARAAAAYEAVTKARSLAAEGSEHEQAYIEALSARYSSDPKADRPALARAFSQAMGALSRRYPDDLDAAVIYAESLMNLTPWKLWTLDHKPAARTKEIVSILEGVLLRNPNHSAPITTTFMPWKPPGRRLGRSRAHSGWTSWPNRPGIFSTCQRTSTPVRVITPQPPRPTRPVRQPIAATSSRRRRIRCTG